ncbi:lysylphosphatidylglycerol synthase transmembrane domain-containing protein [Anaerocolumna xylanovorans]|uniref:Phosphatidylglycerol lysyltransferase n=1 Tax=Anaerocolumna xylanovorans DSM 12503 TaxID=1121345 RepID=A0A1M7YB19_9FIRM|nr:lysylphosphatidylglycerol synthase transmembrane domain-containing protein [Anaerocolumna xylanovorans]SHO49817.1 Lysylphosphatidylglycerol synthase TM region [Anaerocolumna xylanovorans DSM 12503]
MKIESINKKWIKKALAGILIGIAVFISRNLIYEGLLEMRNISLVKIIVICLLSLCYMTAEGVVVKQVAGKHVQRMSIYKCLECAFYCAFLRIATFGSGAGLGEIYYLHEAGIKTAKATGISLIQYMLHKITIVLYGTAGFILLFPVIRRFNGNLTPYMVSAIAITVGIVAGIVFISLPTKSSRAVLTAFPRLGKGHKKWQDRINRLTEQARVLQEASGEFIKEKKRLARILFLDFFKFTCWYLIPFVIYGSDTGLTVGEMLVLTALTNMLAGVIPVPSGLGALEAVFVIVYSPILGEQRSVSLALVYRLVTTLLPFLIGSVIAWNLGRTNIKEIPD